MKACKFDIQQDKVYDKIIFNWLYDRTMNNTEGIIKHIPKPLEKEFNTWVANRMGYGKRYMMATINFRPDITMERMKVKLEKCLRKVWIEQYMYCWEVRKPNEGIHIHLKIWKTKKKRYGECRREIYNTFKDCVGDYKHVHLKYSNDENCFEEYIKGFKKGREKKCWKASVDFRKEHGLNDIYIGSL